MASENPKTADSLAAPEKAEPAEELRYRLRQQQLSTEYALFALQTHDVGALLESAAQACAQGLLSKLCKVMEFLPDENNFVVRAGVGWNPGVVGSARVGADTASPTGYAFQTGEPVISNHLGGESRFRTPTLLAEHGVKRAINTVIRVGGERYGVLEVDSPIEGRFTEADLTFVAGVANLLGVALERQRSEEALLHKEALLQQALEHQEVLAKEISHRVKNSLAIVAGLLHMQSRASADEALTEALAAAQHRVHIIARVHDRLWRRDEVRSVDLADFLGDLCANLRVAAPDHDLSWEVPSVAVSTDQAIALGLLVNELITNSVKYAYPEGAGPVSLRVALAGPDALRLEVADSGVGLPEAAGPGEATGLGGRVIATLCRQLGGEPEWQDAGPGTRFVLRFRPESVAGRP